MPMIRYDIGDLAITESGDCACGRAWPGFSKIVGRDTDIVVTPAGRTMVVHHFNNVLRLYDGIDQFQVIQDDLAEITLKLVTNEKYSSARDESEVLARLQELTGEGCTIWVEHCDEIPVPPTGKRRYIISRVGTARASHAKVNATQWNPSA